MHNGIKVPEGRLGAVLRLRDQTDPVPLTRHGPWVVTSRDHAKRVLTDPGAFDFPSDVSRRALSAPDPAEGSSRSPHAITPPLAPTAVARGTHTFAEELASAVGDAGAGDVDAMQLLRRPVARSTTTAVLPDLPDAERDRVGDLVLGWIDALGPVIAAGRPPGRWSRLRRRETQARTALEDALTAVGEPAAATATVLAAGIQVPIAAGAWLLVALAADPDLADRLRERSDLDQAVAWETVRLYPPTWITARMTTAAVSLGATDIPSGAVVMVSPLLLGRSPQLAPEAPRPLDDFDPFRWDQSSARPGGWLPFGAGPHSCPGRNLGLAQLTQLAGWARTVRAGLEADVAFDQSRGIFPRPARLSFVPC